MDQSSNENEISRVNGYRGIWYELGHTYEYGDRYSGGLGAYTAYHQPAAIYSERFQKTFFTYGGAPSADRRHLLIMVSYYNHQTGTVPQPVLVCDKNGVDDPHDNGVIQMDADGYLYVFVSGRNTLRPGLIYRSMEPGCIDGFQLISEQQVTYPQAWWVPNQGFCFLFTKYSKGVKGPSRELYWKTSADGVEWSADHELARFGGHYQVSGLHAGKIATFFNWHPESDNNERTNLYYAQTKDYGETWTTAGGDVLELPLDQPANAALVIDYHSEGRLVYTCDINFDAEGGAILLYVCSRDGNPGPQGEPRELRMTRWDGERWQTSVVAVLTHNYDMGSLYVQSDLWRVIAPTEAGPDPLGTGGEVAVWVSRDQGTTWQREQNVTNESETNHSHVRRPLSAKDPFFAFWADGDTRALSASKLYFCDASGRSVYQLPYTMESDWVKPMLAFKDGAKFNQ